MAIAFLSALICVITRAILNVCDRSIFKKDDTDFLKSILYNAIFPFVIAWIVAEVFGEGNPHFSSLFFKPGVILSAFGAQLAAIIFSYCFSKMPVKSVVASSKMADLVIPLTIFIVTSEFTFMNYFFSCLSTLLFLPIIIILVKNKSERYYKTSLALITVLVFQASINSYFAMHKLANTWPMFLSMMTCILLWRTFFLLIPYCWKWVKRMYTQEESTTKQVDYLTLLLRAFLAFISQAAFFYSITRISGSFAWPLLNSTPLVACYTAHIILNEEIGKVELWILSGFLVLSVLYITLNWSVI